MTQIIKTESVDFNALIKTNTSLTLDCQSKMIEILTKEFTEEESKWYIANLYIYMNYHPTNDFPINLETLIKLVDFANKQNAKRTLVNNFTEGEDYKILLIPKDEQVKTNGGAGLNKEKVMLNIDTFKNMCMLVKTEKSKQIRKYYVKLENIYNKIIKEEIEEKKKELENSKNNLHLLEIKNKEKDELIKLLENKPDTEGFIRTEGYIYLIRDISKPGHYKIGLAEDPHKRLIALNVSSSTNSLVIIKSYKTKDTILSEKIIHLMLSPHKIKKQKEWFYIHNEDLLQFIIRCMIECIEFVDKHIFNSIEEELQSLHQTNNILFEHLDKKFKTIKTINTYSQTDIEVIDHINIETDNPDEIIFNRFLNDSCIIDDLVYCSKRELIYQYKTWSKINNIFNHKNFEQYLLSKFRSKKMLNEMLNTEMCCVLGIKLKDSFYTFDFRKPYGEFEEFINESCVKLPTAKLNRSVIKNTYEIWCKKNNKTFPDKKKMVSLCSFLDKYFFKDKFYEGDTTYLGWYGITIKENILKGTGINSSICKKNKIYKIYKDEPYKIIQQWESQKDAANFLCICNSTLKTRIDNKYIFKDNYNKEYYLVRENHFTSLNN